MSATFAAGGAALVSFKTEQGHELNIKFDNLANYGAPGSGFVGASIGRIANRIFGAAIELEGKTYELPVVQEPKITLHGGPKGFNVPQWAQKQVTRPDGKQSTVFSLTSDHLDQGFPGKLNVTATYTPYTVEQDGVKKFVVELEYEAKLADDSPANETVVSLTNHSYLNPSGQVDTLEGIEAKFASNQYIELADDKSGPTGKIVPLSTVPADGSKFVFGKEDPDFDHGFVAYPFDDFKQLDTRFRQPQEHVQLYDPKTKTHLSYSSTEPVFQVYSCGGMNIAKLPGESRGFGRRGAVAVEPARPTSAATVEPWKKWVTLKKGDTYGSKIIWSNWVSDGF